MINHYNKYLYIQDNKKHINNVEGLIENDELTTFKEVIYARE